MKNNLFSKNILPFIIGVVGIIIILVSGMLSERSDKAEEIVQSADKSDLDAYVSKIENKIKTLCEACKGVSNVSVIITLDGGFEYEYAKNAEFSDGTHGNERNEEYLVIGQGSNQKCVILRQKLPMISGVGIVCNGADNELIKSELTLLISAALNVGVNKIYITEAS